MQYCWSEKHFLRLAPLHHWWWHNLRTLSSPNNQCETASLYHQFFGLLGATLLYITTSIYFHCKNSSPKIDRHQITDGNKINRHLTVGFKNNDIFCSNNKTFTKIKPIEATWSVLQLMCQGRNQPMPIGYMFEYF